MARELLQHEELQQARSVHLASSPVAARASSPPTSFRAAAGDDAPQPDLLRQLNPAGRALVLDRGRPRLYRRGQPIFRQGEQHDGIFLIESGLVRVFYTAPSGREITLAYWMAGNFCGGPEIFGVGTHVWSGTAVRDTRVLCLSGPVLRDLIERLPALALGIIDSLIFKGSCYSHLAQLLGTRSVSDRLSGVLHQLARVYGRASADGVEVTMPFTHDDLAGMVGATRQWVSITLKRFADQGLLTMDRRRLVILQPERLAAMSDGLPDARCAALA